MRRIFVIITSFCIILRLCSFQVLALTTDDLAVKLGQVLDKREQTYPLYQQVGYDVNNDGIVESLARIDTIYNNISPEERAEWRARLFCDPKPMSTTDLNSWAAWRGCMGGSHVILALYHLRNYLDKGQNPDDLAKAQAHFYMEAVHVDTLSTGTGFSPIFGQNLDDATTYKLRDTAFSARYLADNEPGYMNAFGLGYYFGVLPRYYCTALELPYDSGKNCKTIPLWSRIRKIASAGAVKAAGEWLIHNDGTLRTEYWNNTPYWTAAKAGLGYSVSANTNFQNWYDLAGRKTMGENYLPYAMEPVSFLMQIGGMTDAAALVLNEGGIYRTIYDYGLNFGGEYLSLEINNPGDNAILNIYGYPLRSLSTQCNGTITPDASDPSGICTGGTTEYFMMSRGVSPYPDQKQMAYDAQHLGVMAVTSGWSNLPDSYSRNALAAYYAIKATYFKDGDSYIDTTNGSFNAAVINKYLPTGTLCACGVSNCKYYQNPDPSNRVVAASGESAAEFLATTIPIYYQMVNNLDPSKGNELLTITDQALTQLATNPLTPVEGNCAAGGGTGGMAANSYARAAWQEVNFLTGYYFFKKIPVGPIVKDCDLNADGAINSRDVSAGISLYGKIEGDCAGAGKTNSLTMAKILRETDKPQPAAVAIPTPSLAVPVVLPDQISWGSWTPFNLLNLGFPAASVPLDTREVLKLYNGKWYDSITKGNYFWNRSGSLPTALGSWVMGDYNTLAAADKPPAEAFPFQTRSYYQGFDGKWVESITTGQYGYNRMSTDSTGTVWGAFSKVDLLNSGIYSWPQRSIGAQGRTVYIADNNLMMDLIVKDGLLYYRTFNKNMRVSTWSSFPTSLYGFPEAAQSGVDTLAVWKDPTTGKWNQNITKGADGWSRQSL